LMDKVLIGTSDIPIENPDEARCTEDEVDYFLEMIARVFPSIKVNRSHIVFRFSGVRPLAYTQAKIAGQITRDHHIQEDVLGDIPVYSLVGGKWTSYRAFSEQVTDKVLSYLGLARKAGTQNLPIGGGKDYPWTGYIQLQFFNRVHELTGLPDRWPKILFDRYGTRAQEIAAFMAADYDAALKHKPDMTRREIAFLTQHEKIVHLDDLLLRRSMLAFLGELTRPLVGELAEYTGETLGWAKAQKKAEMTRALDILADRHGVRL